MSCGLGFRPDGSIIWHYCVSAFSSMSYTSCFFMRELLSVVDNANVLRKSMQCLPKHMCHRLKVLQSHFGVKTELCICVPGCKVEQEVNDDIILIDRDQAFKYWNSTLEKVRV